MTITVAGALGSHGRPLASTAVTYDSMPVAQTMMGNPTSEIYNRLGAATAPPDPARLSGRQNYVARIIVTIVTCGIYGFWWLYDLMIEWNQHFEHNWRWEDGLAASVQTLLPTQAA